MSDRKRKSQGIEQPRSPPKRNRQTEEERPESSGAGLRQESEKEKILAALSSGGKVVEIPWSQKDFNFSTEDEDILFQYVAAARNSPFEESRDSDRATAGKTPQWWQLVIQLGSQKNADQGGKFSDKYDDRLGYFLSPKTNFPDVFMMKEMKEPTPCFILQVRSDSADLATVDYRTTMSMNKGLANSRSLGMPRICYYLYEKEEASEALPPTPAELSGPLEKDEILRVSEEARLQFKRLRVGDGQNIKKQKKCKEVFDPKSGKDYVTWIWEKSKRNLNEYITVFTKTGTGGSIYYGLREQNLGEYEVEGLDLKPEWREELLSELERRIRNQMLWLKKASKEPTGYRELKPEEIQIRRSQDKDNSKHISISFIDVNTRGQQNNSCILEVRVSPFNGIVFYDKEGPESYRMVEIKEDKFRPERLKKEEWLDRMVQHGWCTTHRRSKAVVCPQCR